MTLPTTVYLDRIPNIQFDISRLVQEFNTVEGNLKDAINHVHGTLVQRKLNLIYAGSPTEYLVNLDYTREVIQEMCALHEFDSVTYRSVLPNTCYNWHVDAGTNWVHIPIITSIGARFVFENRSFFMPADGSAYVVNNQIPHTFMNAGPVPRIHLTFAKL
jgi:hypothetical protein